MLKVGTLSFEGQSSNGSFKLCLTSRERRDVISAVLDAKKPDVLVCAGYTQDTMRGLEKLGKLLRERAFDGLVFAEVKNCSGGDSKLKKKTGHQLFSWKLETGWEFRARQHLASGAQAAQNGWREEFHRSLKKREVDFRGIRFGVLICGEVQVIRKDSQYPLGFGPPTGAIDKWLKGIQVVINPTHDRMSPRGFLKEKREFLSRNGAYVSASNWNRSRSQAAHWSSLHSLIASGVPVDLVSCPISSSGEYREAYVAIN